VGGDGLFSLTDPVEIQANRHAMLPATVVMPHQPAAQTIVEVGF